MLNTEEFLTEFYEDILEEEVELQFNKRPRLDMSDESIRMILKVKKFTTDPKRTEILKRGLAVLKDNLSEHGFEITENNPHGPITAWTRSLVARETF